MMILDQYVEQQGSGSPVIFIHGSYATTSTWKKIVGQLSTEHHCISIKLPGHGGAPDPNDFSDPTIESELAILEGVVNALTDKPIHLVGHSYGGVVALAQALKGNLAIKQMTLFEPVSTWVLDITKDIKMCLCVNNFLKQYRRDVSQGKPYCCGEVINFWCGDGAFETLPDVIKDGMAPLVLNNIRHWDICTTIGARLVDLQQCEIPTQVVCGTQSNPVAHAISEHLSKEMPDCKKHVIQGANHFLVTSHANECLSILQDYMISQ